MSWIANTLELIRETKPGISEILGDISPRLLCPPPTDIIIQEDNLAMVWTGGGSSVMALRVWADKYTITYTEYGEVIDIAESYRFKALREFTTKGHFFIHYDWINDALLTQSLKSTILQNPDAHVINTSMSKAIHDFIDLVGCTVKPNQISVKSPYIIELTYRGKTLDDSALVTFTVDRDAPSSVSTTIMHLEEAFIPLDEDLFLTNFSLTKGVLKKNDGWTDKYITANGGIVPAELRELIRSNFPAPAESTFCTLTRSHVLVWRIDHKKALTVRLSTIQKPRLPNEMYQLNLHANSAFESINAIADILKTCRLDTQQCTYLTT